MNFTELKTKQQKKKQKSYIFAMIKIDKRFFLKELKTKADIF